MPYPRLFFTLALCGLVSACGHDSSNSNLTSSGHSSIGNGSIQVEGNEVTLHPDNTPRASIDNSGRFSVDGKPIATNDAQRLLLKHYYDASAAIRQHGIETGKAGAAMAGHAFKEAVSSAFKGDGEGAEKRINAQADKVKQVAQKICTDLGDIRTAQNQLGSTLPAFRPYANLIQSEDVDDCMKDDQDN